MLEKLPANLENVSMPSWEHRVLCINFTCNLRWFIWFASSMSHVACPVSVVRCPMSNVHSLTPEVRCLMADAWCLAARHVCHSMATATGGDPVPKLAGVPSAYVNGAVRFDRFVLIACQLLAGQYNSFWASARRAEESEQQQHHQQHLVRCQTVQSSVK